MIVPKPRRFTPKRIILAVAAVGILTCASAFGGLYAYASWYGINVLLRRGGTTWETVTSDSPSLSPSMRLALQNPSPAAAAGPFA